jgi:capsule polysaccharide export protein KpsE/RkpR
VAIAIVKRAPKVGDEELLLRDLRHALRVTTSKETGFVTMSVQAVDSGAVRAFLGAVTDETQRLFAEVARSQARQLLRAQERRLDSASAELKRSEDRLLSVR